MRKTRLYSESGPEPGRNIKRILRPRLEFTQEEGFNGSEVKKALLASLYEKEKQERRRAAELEKKKELVREKSKKEKKKKKKKPSQKIQEKIIPSTQDFVRFISLDYTSDTADLPKDLERFRKLPLESIPNPY